MFRAGTAYDAGKSVSDRCDLHAGQRQNDEKIIAVPFNDPNYNCYHDISELPSHVVDEMEHFFTVYKALENKTTAVNEKGNREEAIEVIKKCLDNYIDTFIKSW